VIQDLQRGIESILADHFDDVDPELVQAILYEVISWERLHAEPRLPLVRLKLRRRMGIMIFELVGT